MIRPGSPCLVVQGPFPASAWGPNARFIGRTCQTLTGEQTRFCICGFLCYEVAIAGEPSMLIATPCLIPLTPPSTDSVERGTEWLPERVTL